MISKDYVDFANENRVCYLATMDRDQPRVRALGMFYADETGFYFNTESTKALAGQLKNNQKVELCYFSPKETRMMRVTAKVEFIDDMAIRTRFFEERPILKKAGVKGPEDPFLVVFAIRSGEAYFWTMENNTKEAEIERFKF
ncbi:MAG: pyridoxamine 5'-phosphate oxidase family protein [Chloroflexota bacterium]